MKTAQALVCAVFLCATFTSFADCYPDHSDSLQTVEVDKVFDGDTFRLKDGRKVRLLGINAPETGYYGKAGEAFSQKSRQKLISLIKGKTVQLKIGKPAQDKYSRVLANVFLHAQGTSLLNPVNVTKEILESGLGHLLIIPPNVEFADCYKHAQIRAQNARLNLFSGDYKLKFSRQTGKLIKIKQTKNSTWLYLEHKKYIRISRGDLKYFAKICLACMTGKTISFQGWWRKSKNSLRLRLYHPLMMDINE